ncbi:hypothetical protein J6590_103657 [Homalodisca vitripennis]|nr:hypothetical protein J6590_103657 [Homalodisca vitripennis]
MTCRLVAAPSVETFCHRQQCMSPLSDASPLQSNLLGWAEGVHRWLGTAAVRSSRQAFKGLSGPGRNSVIRSEDNATREFRTEVTDYTSWDVILIKYVKRSVSRIGIYPLRQVRELFVNAKIEKRKEERKGFLFGIHK